MMTWTRFRSLFLLSLLLIFGVVTPVSAQLGSVPYVFSAGTTIRSSEVNALFSAIYSNALNRTGGTMTGTLTSLQITPGTTNTYDLGTSSVLFRTGYFGTSVILGAATTSGIRLDLETGTLAVREGDDSGYGPLTAGAVTVTTLNTYTFNQSVASGAAPTFTGTNFTGIPISTAISGLGTGVATWLATPSSANLISAVTDETGSGALVFGTGATITTANTGLRVLDTNASHYLQLYTTSDLTADRSLAFVTGDASRVITLSGDPTLADWFNQSVKTTASPTFAAPTVTTLEIGAAATDTTLSRVSAGLAAIEGDTIALLGKANVFTAAQTIAPAAVGNAYYNFRVGATSYGLFGISGAWLGDSSTNMVMAAQAGGSFRIYTNGATTNPLTYSSTYTLAWGGGSAINTSSNVALLDAANTFTNANAITADSAGDAVISVDRGNTTGVARYLFETAGVTDWILDTYDASGDLRFNNGTSAALTLNKSTLAATFGQDVILAATSKLRVDGSASGNTYFTESSADVLDTYAGGVLTTRVSSTTFTVLGAEGTYGLFSIRGDEGDDAGDIWTFQASPGSDKTLYLAGNAEGNGAGAFKFVYQGATPASPALFVGLGSGTYGTTAVGATVFISANASGSGAAGALALQPKSGSTQYVWADNTGDLRIHTTQPVEDGGTTSDTAGTVVGDQTSLRSAKTVYGAFTDNAHALRTMVDTPLWTWSYANGRYHGEKFMGITLGDGPENANIFGKDNGKAFNELTFAGYTIAAIKELNHKIELLEAEVSRLRNR